MQEILYYAIVILGAYKLVDLLAVIIEGRHITDL